jgi:PAS domain S-box-containing protein
VNTVAPVLAWVFAAVAAVLAGLLLVTRTARSRLEDAERRSRLGAEHARLHLFLLAQAGDELSGALESYDGSLERLYELVVPRFADWFAVDLVDDEGNVRRVLPAGEPHRHPEGDDLVRRVVDSGHDEVFAASPHGSHPGSLMGEDTGTTAGTATGIESMLVVPVQVRGVTLGALSFVTGPRRRGYRRSDLETARGLALRVAVAVERVLVWRGSREAEVAAVRRADQLHRLMEASLAVNAPLAESDVVRVLAEHARRVVSAKRASVFTIPEGSEDEVMAALCYPETDPDQLSPAVPASCKLAARLDRPVRLVGDGLEGVPRDLEVDASLRPGAADTAWLALPLTHSEDEPRRVVVVEQAKEHFFDAEDESVLALLAQIGSVALVNARLYEEVGGSERRLRTVVGSSPLAIAELEPDGEARWWNGAADRLFGAASEGSPRRMRIHPDSEAAWEELLKRSRETLSSVGSDIRSLGPDSEPVDLSVSSAALLGSDGEVTGIVVVAEDVTERRRVLEQMHQSERLSAMARMAGGMAHDFNNLLTVIVGSTELLAASDGLDEVSRAEVEAIQRASRRASLLTSQLLAIGTDRSGHPTSLDPDEVLASIGPMLSRVLGDSIELVVEPASVPVRVYADAADLERAVLNLAINARDAMPEGGSFVLRTRLVGSHSGADVRGAPSDLVCISASDTGVGMDSETARRCFDPFYSTKADVHGTGLGLFAVQAIVASAGGHVTLETRRGAGSTFSLWLPARTNGDSVEPRGAPVDVRQSSAS